MTVGCLGDIVFQVSSETMKTINNFNWSGSVQYAIHQRHATHALTEFTGMNPDKITLDIYLSAYFGTNVQEEMTKIWTYERNGTTLPLVLGSKGYGKYRWNITQHQMKAKTFDGRGNVTTATVSLTLQEYLRG